MAKGDVHLVPGDKGSRVEIEGTARARSSRERRERIKLDPERTPPRLRPPRTYATFQ